ARRSASGRRVRTTVARLVVRSRARTGRLGARPILPCTTMSATTDIDRRHLARAIGLAEGGIGRVSPNPLVGAVIGRREEILGEGFHQALGAPHAEVEAIQAAAGHDLDGATL